MWKKDVKENVRGECGERKKEMANTVQGELGADQLDQRRKTVLAQEVRQHAVPLRRQHDLRLTRPEALTRAVAETPTRRLEECVDVDPVRERAHVLHHVAEFCTPQHPQHPQDAHDVTDEGE